MIPTLTSKLLSEAGTKIGAVVECDPTWNYAGRIIFRDGKISYFIGSALNLNHTGSAELSKDKDYTSFFLSRQDFRVPEGRVFFSDRWAEAIGSRDTARRGVEYAEQLGYPVIVKPNSLRGGQMIYLCDHASSVASALKEILAEQNVALVQRRVTGRDYRLLVLDDELLVAYERLALSVSGDGKRTFTDLFLDKERDLRKNGRHVSLREELGRISAYVACAHGMRMDDVPEAGKIYAGLPNANMSTGGSMTDVTEIVHKSYIDLAVRATRALGLRYCGVDIMTNSSISEQENGSATIIELNGKEPGISHYASYSDATMERARNSYKKIILALSK